VVGFENKYFFSSFSRHWWREWQSLINVTCVKSALCTGVWHILGAWVFYGCACCILHNYCRFFIVYRNAYYFSCTSQALPDRHEVYRSFQNFGSLVWNLLHIALLVPSIQRWLLDFWKICGPLTIYIKINCNLPSFMGFNLTYSCERCV